MPQMFLLLQWIIAVLFLLFFDMPAFAVNHSAINNTNHNTNHAILNTAHMPYPAISIVIDDMGYHSQKDAQIVNLPGAVTCAVIPHSIIGTRIAKEAHAVGKQVIAHIPMQPEGHEKLDAGGLTLADSPQQFAAILRADLSTVPYAQGMNNHMGSLLTQEPKQMLWLMQDLRPTGMFYLDSRTTAKTVAEQIADAHGVMAIRRNIFLDDVQTEAGISQQFARLIQLARKQGMAVAIGHPYPATIAYLQHELPQLKKQGITLVPLSEAVSYRMSILNAGGKLA